MLLVAERSVLLIVDIQERLMPVVHAGDRVIANAVLLLEAARELAVPVLASEQYPQGLGPNVAAIRARLPEGATIEKAHFSCLGEPGFRERLVATGRDQVVLAGAEAHICVLQTALALRAAGWAVFVVADATSSRAPGNAELGVERARENGAEIVTTEMVVFEWLGKAGTPAFKRLSALVK